MSEEPLDLDKHRGMAAQKATENAARDRGCRKQRKANCASGSAVVENELLSVQATSWPEAAAKACYILNLYAAGLPPDDTHHRNLVAVVLADFARLDDNV